MCELYFHFLPVLTVYVCACCPGIVCEGGGHLPVDQLPVRLPVCDRVRSCELLHHSGGDEEDEEGEGQHWTITPNIDREGKEGGTGRHGSHILLNVSL